ncbi:MAG: glutamate--cysteine ligase, partial [Pseudomonadales bacterium]
MAVQFSDKLRALAADQHALIFNRGIEREALRVDDTGSLARTTHPEFLGSKLCHPSITTDFSEAQLELITPVS